MNIDREELIGLLEKAFDEGWQTYREMKEFVVREIVETYIKEKPVVQIIDVPMPLYDRVTASLPSGFTMSTNSLPITATSPIVETNVEDSQSYMDIEHGNPVAGWDSYMHGSRRPVFAPGLEHGNPVDEPPGPVDEPPGPVDEPPGPPLEDDFEGQPLISQQITQSIADIDSEFEQLPSPNIRSPT